MIDKFISDPIFFECVRHAYFNAFHYKWSLMLKILNNALVHPIQFKMFMLSFVIHMTQFMKTCWCIQSNKTKWCYQLEFNTGGDGECIQTGKFGADFKTQAEMSWVSSAQITGI